MCAWTSVSLLDPACVRQVDLNNTRAPKRTSWFSVPLLPAIKTTTQCSLQHCRATRLYSHHVASEMKWKSVCLRLTGSSYSNRGKKKGVNFQPCAPLCMRLLWESALPGENIKDFYLFFFIVKRQWTIFPWNTKAVRRGPMTWCTPTESPFLRPLFCLSLYIVAHLKKALSGI